APVLVNPPVVPPPAAAVPLGAHRRGDARSGAALALVDVHGVVTVVAVDEDARALRVATLAGAGREAAVTAGTDVRFDARPSQVVVGVDGRVYCALRDAGAIAVLDWGKDGQLSETARWRTDADPVAMALSPDEATLVVATAAPGALEGLSIRDGARTFHVSIPRSPRSVSVSRDGRHAAITHAAGSLLTFVHLERDHDVETRPIDVAREDLPKLGKVPLLHAGSPSVLGDELIVPGVATATGDVTVRTKDGYGHLAEERIPAGRFGVVRVGTVVDRVDAARVARAGMLAESCLLPRASAVDEGGQWLWVACAGPGRLFKIDLAPEARRAAVSWTAPLTLPDGVVGLVLDAASRTVVAWSAVDRTLVTVGSDERATAEEASVAPGGFAVAAPATAVHPLGSVPERDAVARGRAIFYGTNRPDVSHDGRACASCHIDGGEDGVTWPTPEGPRQTPMLAGRVIPTPPYGWSGKRATLPEHLRETIRRLGGRGLSDADRDDVIAFLGAMPAPPRAQPAPALVERGRAVFQSMRAECSVCHDGAMATDRKKHDVHSGVKADEGGAFDTPSLVSAARTAPYFHDGRYRSLEDLLRGADGTMGRTSHLSPADLEALLAYVRSL
ncbi:MAG: hypothetical protein ABSE49_09765, partial [Polyangiaceae bacterium]